MRKNMLRQNYLYQTILAQNKIIVKARKLDLTGPDKLFIAFSYIFITSMPLYCIRRIGRVD